MKLKLNFEELEEIKTNKIKLIEECSKLKEENLYLNEQYEN